MGHAFAQGLEQDGVGNGDVGSPRRLQRESGGEKGGRESLAFAGALAVEQGGADSHRAAECGDVVGRCGCGDVLGRAVFVDLEVAGEQSRVGLHNDVGAGAGGAGPAVAVAGDVEIDEVGSVLAQRRVVDADALSGAGSEVGDEDVEVGYESVEEGLAVDSLQVDHESAFASVEGVERFALAGSELVDSTGRFACGRFELDDVRAQIGERHAAVRASNDLAQLEHLDPIERSWHCASLGSRLGEPGA